MKLSVRALEMRLEHDVQYKSTCVSFIKIAKRGLLPIYCLLKLARPKAKAVKYLVSHPLLVLQPLH